MLPTKTMMIRDLPAEIARALKKEAAGKGITLKELLTNILIDHVYRGGHNDD